MPPLPELILEALMLRAAPKPSHTIVTTSGVLGWKARPAAYGTPMAPRQLLFFGRVGILCIKLTKALLSASPLDQPVSKYKSAVSMSAVAEAEWIATPFS